MKIKIIAAAILVLLTLFINLSLADSSSNSANTSEWRMTSRDLNRTAFYPGYTPSNISLVTQITKTGLSLSSAQATVADGFMYIADNARLYKVNASNVSQQIDQSGSISTLYITGPTVWDTFVYVTSGSTYYQFNTSNLSSTYASFGVGSQSWANPVVYNNRIYLLAPVLTYYTKPMPVTLAKLFLTPLKPIVIRILPSIMVLCILPAVLQSFN